MKPLYVFAAVALWFEGGFAESHSSEDEWSLMSCLAIRIQASAGGRDAIDESQIASNLGTSARARQIRIREYADLFSDPFPSNNVAYSWCPLERQETFEHFFTQVPMLSTNVDANGRVRPGLEALTTVGLGHCARHKSTNILESVKAILVAPHAVARATALDYFKKVAVPSHENNDFARMMLTNDTTSMRDNFLNAYIDLLRENRVRVAPDVFTNGLRVVLNQVSGVQGAIAIDELCLEICPTYHASSNRLAIARAALADDAEQYNYDQEFINNYFAPITNQLMNAVQPLPEVEELNRLLAPQE